MDDRAEEIIKRYDTLDANKGTLKSHLQEIAEYMCPSLANFTTTQTPGGKRMTNVFDGTAIRAQNLWTNGLYGHLTPPSTPWFALTTKNKSLKTRWDVSQWLADTSTRMMDAINASNFGAAIQDVYRQLGLFGTPVLYVEPGRRDLLNFRTFSVGTVCIDENSQGRIDTVINCEKFTARQAVQNWGEKISDEIKKAQESTQDTKFEVLHAVLPREEFDPRRRDNLNMPWASIYLEKKTGQILEESGYREFPYMVPLLNKTPGELYGRGLGMDALPDVKMVNLMSKADIKAHQKMADPPIIVPDEMRMNPLRMSPGGITYYAGEKKPEYWPQPTSIQLAMEYEEQRRKAILDTFFCDLFLFLAQAPTGMTATEVLERAEERLMLLGPTLGATKPELFDPMLERIFWIMYRGGFITPPPKSLVNQGLEIEYVSKLAMAMRAFETQAMTKTLGLISPLSQIKPDIMDNFNLDNFARGTAERSGVPVDWLTSEGEIRAIRESRAKAQAEAQAKAEQVLKAEQVIKAGPQLLKAPEPGSAINSMMEQIGQGNK
jgi:hypothetical protein